MTATRENRLLEAFVRAADTLVADYDVIELLQQLTDDCVDLLAADTAGLLLGDHRGALRLAASTSEDTRLLELFQLQVDQGPCLDTFTTGTQTLVVDLHRDGARWPSFTSHAVDAGFRAVHALPLRLREQTIGVIGLFNHGAGGLDTRDLTAAQALADVATIGVLHQRAVVTSEALNEQLQGALNSRIVIEQAKGILAERGGVDMTTAFNLLRAYSRRHRTRLSDTARSVIDGTLGADAVTATTRPSATLDPAP